MLYVVCAYMAICCMALFFLPGHIPEKRAKKKTIFDKEESIDTGKKVKDHRNNSPEILCK